MRRQHCAFFIALSLALTSCVHAAYKDDIGFTDLLNELGAAMPTGAGIIASQVEAAVSGNYRPSTTNTQFSDTSFTFMSGASGVSSHATDVGYYLYGNTSSLSPDLNTVESWSANDWLTYSGDSSDNGVLYTGWNLEPEDRSGIDIENHSWVSAFEDDADNQDALRRYDYVINRDGVVAVVGVNNSSSTDVPNLMAAGYNSIAVGRSDGNHSRGTTQLDTVGRTKPDIVAPLGTTSYATPLVSSAAALLLETIDNTPQLVNADNPESIKAILMAGATKDEFPSWDRTPTRPLDEVYGAGELNIYNSYQILTEGEQLPSVTEDVAETGWDFNQTTTVGDSLNYFFDLETGADYLSIILNWNREIQDGINGPGWGTPTAFLADLTLEFYTASGYSLGSLLDFSDSSVDNVEHIYQTSLAAGRYAISVSGDTAGQDFSLAWFSLSTVVIPEPTTGLFLVLSGVLLLQRRSIRPRRSC